MPARSRAQQRLFGMVHAYQKGSLKNPPAKVREIAKSIDPGDAKDFAQTSHASLPEKAESMEASKQAAVKKMAAYIDGVADKILARMPRGEKSAGDLTTLTMAGRFYKLAADLRRTGDLRRAVVEAFPGKTAAYHQQVLVGLVKGALR